MAGEGFPAQREGPQGRVRLEARQQALHLLDFGFLGGHDCLAEVDGIRALALADFSLGHHHRAFRRAIIWLRNSLAAVCLGRRLASYGRHRPSSRHPPWSAAIWIGFVPVPEPQPVICSILGTWAALILVASAGTPSGQGAVLSPWMEAPHVADCSIGSPAAFHSGKPSSSLAARRPSFVSSRTASSAYRQYGPRQ